MNSLDFRLPDGVLAPCASLPPLRRWLFHIDHLAGMFLGLDLRAYRRFPDNHFPGLQTVPGQTFPGQVVRRNFHVYNVREYQLYSHTICWYTGRLLMCARRPAVSRPLYDDYWVKSER